MAFSFLGRWQLNRAQAEERSRFERSERALRNLIVEERDGDVFDLSELMRCFRFALRHSVVVSCRKQVIGRLTRAPGSGKWSVCWSFVSSLKSRRDRHQEQKLQKQLQKRKQLELRESLAAPAAYAAAAAARRAANMHSVPMQDQQLPLLDSTGAGDAADDEELSLASAPTVASAFFDDEVDFEISAAYEHSVKLAQMSA